MTKERFTTLWQRCCRNEPGRDSSGVYGTLIGHYSEPHRRYHTCEHLEHCLTQLDLGSQPGPDSDAVEMAVWFHDAIYDPRAPDNEQRSAELFARLAGGDFAPAFARHVNELILVTRHDKPPDTNAEKLVVDVDLSSFGLPWEDFIRDSEAVRQEYTHLPDDRFHQYQVKFMCSLLARPALYGTSYFHEHFESAARGNIRRYLESLASLGYSICPDENRSADSPEGG